MKRFIAVIIILLAVTSTAYAGVMEVIKTAASSGTIWVGIVTVVLLYVLKRIPNERIQSIVDAFFYRIGRICTLGLDNNKYTKPFWNGIIEKYVIDLFNNTVTTACNALVRGLRSDNTNGG